MTDAKLTDEQKKAQPLLESHGVIIAPVSVDYGFYHEMSWAIIIGRSLRPDKPLAIHCFGYGGYTPVALAIADIIQADGNVDGLLLGDAASAHSIVWAACKRRYAYPNARISVHKAAHHDLSGRYEDHDLQILADNTQREDEKIAKIYAWASNKSPAWWAKALQGSGVALVEFGAHELINDLDMASPASKRKT